MSKLIDQDLLAIQEMRQVVRKAHKAQIEYMSFTQEQVDHIVERVAEAAFSKSHELAILAVEETGMGVVAHKKLKNEVGSKAVYESIKDEKTVGILNEDREKKVVEIAAPFGVIAAIIPTTNPTSTAFFKTLIALKTRNAIVVSPHPYARKCTIEALKVCEKAAIEAGAPEGIIGYLTYASMGATKALMEDENTSLILATGGKGLVKAAYSSGKPAYGVGPGNVPVYIEKTANVQKAISMIVDSKTFDYGTICATEQAIIVDKNISAIAMRELKNNGAYILSEVEKKKLEKVISPVLGRVNPKIVGKSPAYIASLAGIEIDTSIRLFIGLEDRVGKDVPFSLEKLSPIFALYEARDSTHAKELTNQLLDLGGRGHTFSIHTEDDQLARQFGLDLPVSRILVNTLSSIGAVGGTTGLLPSMTLGCGTFGGNITSDNISARHLINVKRMAYGIKTVDVNVESSSDNNINANAIVQSVMENIDSNHEINLQEVEEIVSKVIAQYK